MPRHSAALATEDHIYSLPNHGAVVFAVNADGTLAKPITDAGVIDSLLIAAGAKRLTEEGSPCHTDP